MSELDKTNKADDRPNILFIMTDQQRYDCVGANGNSVIQTPNLDCLAAQSANFHSCFAQSPVCVPSRGTFFTGRYPHAHKNRVNYTPLDPGETLMQQRLRRAGYATGCVGKLHYYPPSREFAESTGFDKVLIHDAAHTDAYSDYVRWLRSHGPEYVENYRQTEPAPGGNPFRTRLPDELHETTWCGEQTRAMLQDYGGGERPFFIFSSYWKPHHSFEIPDPWAGMYDECRIPLPDPVTLEEIKTYPEPVQKMILRARPEDYLIDRETLQWMYRAYYGAISQIDREVGLTLRTLDRLGLAERTIVIFCSDHGDQMLERGMLGKNVFFEGSVHVPFMMRFPGNIEAGNYHDLIETTDFLPTLFEMCGVEIPPNTQGSSFARLVTNGKAGSEYRPRGLVFGENIIPEVITQGELQYPYKKGEGVGGVIHPDAKMVRSEKWKYNYYVGHGEELFNLEEDPEEKHNLAGEGACQDVVREMKGALLDWMITCDETEQIYPGWCDL